MQHFCGVFVCVCVSTSERAMKAQQAVCALVQVAKCESLEENVCECVLLNEIFV